MRPSCRLLFITCHDTFDIVGEQSIVQSVWASWGVAGRQRIGLEMTDRLIGKLSLCVTIVLLRTSSFVSFAFVEHPRGGVVYNLGPVCVSVCRR